MESCRKYRWLGLVAVMATLAGCARVEPEFDTTERVEELIPPAQTKVREVMDARFGSPTEMVVWELLPLRFHAAEGVVGSIEAEGEVGTLPVTLTEQVLPVEPGTEVLWLSGSKVHKESAWVAQFDAEAGEIALDEVISPPAAGDRIAVGPGVVLRAGRSLYAEHCQHCHGVSGDGAGPTAEYLYPRPRDYRQGIFKFTGTHSQALARREDLARVIENGIPGTYMPSFKLLEPREMDAIVEYVLWLAMRGQTEDKLVDLLGFDYSLEAVEEQEREEYQADFEEYIAEDFEDEFADEMTFVSERWANSQEADSLVLPKEPRPEATPESIERGRELYLSDKTKCATCHGDAALGNGPQTLAVQKTPQGDEYPLPGLYDTWGNPIQPRNLRVGIYRGGRRPLDLYRRIHAGIKGTPMPGFATSLNDQQIWDIVNYVMSLPFEEFEAGTGSATSPAPSQVASSEK